MDIHLDELRRDFGAAAVEHGAADEVVCHGPRAQRTTERSESSDVLRERLMQGEQEGLGGWRADRLRSSIQAFGLSQSFDPGLTESFGMQPQMIKLAERSTEEIPAG